MDDETLLRSFEAGREPPGGFHHREHVRVAWWYLRQEPFEAALQRFTEALQRFARMQGKPQLYHATITAAYMLVIAERLDATGRAAEWDEFAASHPDLLISRPSVLESYYTAGTLASERARHTFVPPDRPGAAFARAAPLEVGND